MPELPEVETIVRHHRDALVGRRVVGFESYWPRTVAPSVSAVRAALCGARITAVDRRSKYIVLTLPPARGWLLIHLRMSGRFEWADDGAAPAAHGGKPARPPAARMRHKEHVSPRGPHTRAMFVLDNGRRLLFDDARKFGRITLIDDYQRFDSSLGPEPLADDFTVARLARALTGRARMLKPLLLDQTIVAGLGNIYTDEALHRAGLHPLRRADQLRGAELERLHEAIRAVLEEGIRRQGTTIDWIYPSGQMQEYLQAYGRTGQPCGRCGTAIIALRVGQRGTHICPRCQPAPRRRRTASR